MASEVCKAYIRGALVTNWFWNKLLGHPHPWNQRWCLRLWVNNHAPNITKVFSIIPAGLRDPESFRQSKRSSEVWNHARFSRVHHRCRVPPAWAGGASHSPQRGAAAPPLPCPHPRAWAPLAAGTSPLGTTGPAWLPPKLGGSFGFIAWDHLCF